MAEKKQLDDVRIGDFSRPLAAPGSGPAKEALEKEERRLDQEVAVVESELKPLSSYEERLKEVGVTREQAAAIVNAIMTRGFWSDEIKITKSLRVRFRTRSKRDTTRAQNYVEAQRPAYDAHYADLMTHQLLAASLEQLGEDKFEHPSRKATADEVEKAFTDRFVYVETLGDPAYRLLAAKLAAFDRKVSVVLEEGTVENF